VSIFCSDVVTVANAPHWKDRLPRECRDWVGGPFDPEAFDAAKATKRMRRGLPDWREMA